MPRMPWPWRYAICRPNRRGSALDFRTKLRVRFCALGLLAQERQPHVRAQLTMCAAHRKQTMKTFPLRFGLLACLASVLLNAPADAGNAAAVPSPAPAHAKLSYRRIFKSSSPEFIEIIVHDDSDAATFDIRQLEEDPGAAAFEVSAPLREKMFQLAAELNNFQGQDLDVHRRIANLGEKTF